MSGGKASSNATASLPTGEAETRLFLNQGRLYTPALHLTLSAAAAAFYIGWWALAWLVLSFCLLAFRVSRRRHSARRGVLKIAAIAAGPLFFSTLWATSWIVGGSQAGLIVGALFCTQVLFSAVFFTSRRLSAIVTIASALVFAIVAPLAIQHDPIHAFVVVLAAALIFLAALMARTHVVSILQEALRNQTEMEAARRDSLAKSRFMATMTHELRTPLNVALGYAEILGEGLLEDGRHADAADVEKIHSAMRQLLGLIDNVLEYSDLELGSSVCRTESIALQSIIQEVIYSLSAEAAQEGVGVHFEAEPSTIVVRSDASKLRQCIFSIVSNAVKFAPNGNVFIRAWAEHSDEGRMISIEVKDTGCGIPPAQMAELFQPFYQTDNSLTRRAGGMGLGLVLAQRTAGMLGGRIDVVSQVNVGSVFTLRIRDVSDEKAVAFAAE